MKYKVISLYCIGRQRSFKKNDIVTASDFADVESKVKGGFLIAVGDDEVTTAPKPKADGEEPRMTDVGAETVIAPEKEVSETEASAEAETSLASIKEVNDNPSEELKIKPAASKGKKEINIV